MSRSTIHRHLASLEDAAGRPLVERHAERIALTPTGELLLPIAERVEEETASAARLFSEEVELAGRVDLAAFEGAGSLLAPALASFQARYPRIEVRLFTSAQVVSLTRRESDVAVRATDQPSERSALITSNNPTPKIENRNWVRTSTVLSTTMLAPPTAAPARPERRSRPS